MHSATNDGPAAPASPASPQRSIQDELVPLKQKEIYLERARERESARASKRESVPCGTSPNPCSDHTSASLPGTAFASSPRPPAPCTSLRRRMRRSYGPISTISSESSEEEEEEQEEAFVKSGGEVAKNGRVCHTGHGLILFGHWPLSYFTSHFCSLDVYRICLCAEPEACHASAASPTSKCSSFPPPCCCFAPPSSPPPPRWPAARASPSVFSDNLLRPCPLISPIPPSDDCNRDSRSVRRRLLIKPLMLCLRLEARSLQVHLWRQRQTHFEWSLS
jgi:hypothetical protein